MSISRRMFLRGAGGVALGLPLLDAMLPRRLFSGLEGRAQAADLTPKRLVVFFTPNGSAPPNWAPMGTETNFTLSPILTPLQPYKSDLLIVDGIDMVSFQNESRDAHEKGIMHVLTGIETGGKLGGGISVDQRIANQIGQQTKFPSLQFGVNVNVATAKTAFTRLAFAGANQPLPAEDNAAAMFMRIFGDLDANPATLMRLQAERKTVLDAVLDQYNTLNARLGADDKVKLGEHVEAIHEIQKRLGGPGGGACQKPTAPMSTNDFQMLGKLQMDLLVAALACDVTRVATLQWSYARSLVVFSWLGISQQHHVLAHQSSATDPLTKINTWHAQQLAYLLGKMKGVQEAGGTMLDNSVVFWCSENATGSHSPIDMPFVLAGSAGRYFKTGRYVSYPGTVSHNNFLLGLLRAFGVNDATFGNPAYCSGPLPRLAG